MTTLTQLLPQLIVGEPDHSGALTVFPLTGPEPRLEYVSYAEGVSRGVTITELPQASVNNLLVANPLDVPVLLYEGEELRGAQQDRTVDGAVLVDPGAKLSVPVSCVEQGRWDHARHAEPFAPSRQTASPELRARKAQVMRTRLAGGLEARADQGEVWAAVGPSAMADSFDASRKELDRLASSITRHDGQTGALVAIADRFAVLDFVSRPDVFAALFAPLVQGYALDGRDGPMTLEPPSTEDAEAWLAGIAATVVTTGDAVGIGRRVHFTAPRAGGTGLAHDEELIQLSVYAHEGPRASRIHRPSRRR